MNSSPPAAPAANPASASIWIKIPAILAIAFCLALGISFLRWTPASIALRYQAIAQKALDQKDYPTAIVAASRLLSLGGETRNDALFKLALANLGLGRNAETAGIMQIIAPVDRPVYAPAHLYVARTLMARAYRPPQVEQAIAAQLENALRLEPDSTEAKELRDRLQNRR